MGGSQNLGCNRSHYDLAQRVVAVQTHYDQVSATFAGLVIDLEFRRLRRSTRCMTGASRVGGCGKGTRKPTRAWAF